MPGKKFEMGTRHISSTHSVNDSQGSVWGGLNRNDPVQQSSDFLIYSRHQQDRSDAISPAKMSLAKKKRVMGLAAISFFLLIGITVTAGLMLGVKTEVASGHNQETETHAHVPTEPSDSNEMLPPEFKDPIWLNTTDPESNLFWSSATRQTDLVINSTMALPSLSIVNVRKIILRGNLTCRPNQVITINVDEFLIDGGMFVCGQSKLSPFTGRVRFNFFNTNFATTTGAFRVTNRGKLLIHGMTRVAWSRLQETALVGASKLKVPSEVDWAVDEEIVIAPSDFIFDAYETFTIRSIQTVGRFKWLTLNASLVYPHYGQTQNMNGRTLESRAEIGLLTRNIQVYGNVDNFHRQNIGVDIRADGGAFAQIHGVEIRNGGTRDTLGRYPMHFHGLGNGLGQYFSMSTIFRSHNRCLSVHCTDSVVLEDNVCVDHRGHGFILEDGLEKNMTIRRNLGIATRAGSGTLIPSDKFNPNEVELAGPATFWMIGGSNIFEDNVAAGSEWVGFAWELDGWSLLDIYAPKSMCPPRNNDIWQYYIQPFGSIRGLIAHSTQSAGIWLRHLYQKPSILRDVQAYKTGESGIHLEMTNGTVNGFIISDSRMGVWCTWPSLFKNGVVVGKSSLANTALGFLNFSPYKTPRFGIQQLGQFIYDGPASLYNVHFENYTTVNLPGNNDGQTCHFLLNGGGAASSKNLVAGLTFRNPASPIFCPKSNFLPHIWDFDGSLSGRQGFLMNPYGFGSSAGIDTLINDGSCTYMNTQATNNAPIISCGLGAKSAYTYFRPLTYESTAGFFVRRTDDGAERRIAAFSDTTFVFYSRPDLTYSMRYTGLSSMCFRIYIRDGQEGEVYRFMFPRSITTPFTGAGGTIPIAASLTELTNPSTNMRQFYEASTNTIHIAIRMTQFYPLSGPSGQNLRIGYSPEKIMCP